MLAALFACMFLREFLLLIKNTACVVIRSRRHERAFAVVGFCAVFGCG